MKLLSTTTRQARAANAKVQLHANPSVNYNGRGAKSLSRAGSPTPGSSRQRASSAPPLRGTSPGRNASPGSARSGSVGRSSRTPSPKPAWNAGPGAQSKSPNSRAGSPNRSPGRTEGISFTGKSSRGQSAGQSGEPSGRLMTTIATTLYITLNQHLFWHKKIALEDVHYIVIYQT